MTIAALRRGMALSVLCSCAWACGRKPEAAKALDPRVPAVVQLPPPVLPSDTAKPDTMMQHRERIRLARRELVPNYAILGAAMVFGDRRMIASHYAPDAVFLTPDTTLTGSVAIANALAAQGPPRSLVEFNRTSIDVTIIDSTVADSGTYKAIAKRAGARDSTIERGSYVATWRVHAPPLHWVITRDEIRPNGKRHRKV